MKDENTYSTSDLPLITVLSIDFPIAHIDRSNRSQVLFHFNNTEELQARVTEYWNSRIQIDPQRFYTQMKYIKSQIYGRGNAD